MRLLLALVGAEHAVGLDPGADLAAWLPLLVSLPHVGTWIPPSQAHRYVERAFAFEDTDWHLERLYGFVRALGASVLVPRHSRYLVDLNRPPENTPMYPGVNNTELCPPRFFTGEPLYREGQAPDDAEVAQRLQRYWRPYHDALAAELARLRSLHGHALRVARVQAGQVHARVHQPAQAFVVHEAHRHVARLQRAGRAGAGHRGVDAVALLGTHAGAGDVGEGDDTVDGQRAHIKTQIRPRCAGRWWWCRGWWWPPCTPRWRWAGAGWTRAGAARCSILSDTAPSVAWSGA